MIKRLNFSTMFFLLSLVFLALMFLFKHDQKAQIEIVFIAAAIYVSFALTHHHFDRSLTLETIIEYILLAALVLIILMGQLI